MGRSSTKKSLILKLVNVLLLLAIATQVSSRLSGPQGTEFSARQYYPWFQKVVPRPFPNINNKDYWTPCLSEDADRWTEPTIVCKEGTHLCGRRQCMHTSNLRLQLPSSSLAVNNLDETKSGNSGCQCVWTGCKKSTEIVKNSEEHKLVHIPTNGESLNNIGGYENPAEVEKSNQTPQNKQWENDDTKIEISDLPCDWSGCMRKSDYTKCSFNSIFVKDRKSAECAPWEIQNCCHHIKSSSIKNRDEQY